MKSKRELNFTRPTGARKCKVAHLPFGKIRGAPHAHALAIPTAFARHQRRIKPQAQRSIVPRASRDNAATTGVSFHPRLLAENIDRGNPEMPYSPSSGF